MQEYERQRETLVLSPGRGRELQSDQNSDTDVLSLTDTWGPTGPAARGMVQRKGLIAAFKAASCAQL